MTIAVQAQRLQLLRKAAAGATLAPSVHNTQPWQITIRPDTLEISADWSRKLRVLDPSGRQLLISCGCAVFNARVVLAAAGYETSTEAFPDATRPDLLARLRVPAQARDWVPIAVLDEVLALRQTNRRQFADEAVSRELIYALIAAAEAEGAELFEIRDPEHRYVTATLSQQADREQNADPAYRAELRAWTADDPRRRDGVPAMAVPHVDAGANDDVPIRDFDTRGMGWLPVETRSSMNQCLLLLGTMDDRPAGWLRAGQALERVLLELTRQGYVASPLTQIVEIPRTRQLLQTELGLDMRPHVLLRVGHAPKTPASRRRLVEDVVTVQE